MIKLLNDKRTIQSMVVGRRSLSLLHPQEVSVLTLLIPGSNIIVRANRKGQLSHALACILITARVFHAQDVLVVLVPIKRIRRKQGNRIVSRRKQKNE